MNKKTFNINFILIIVFFCTSCGTVKDTLFQIPPKNDSSYPVKTLSGIELKNINYKAQTISPGDRLFIRNLQNETQVLGYISGTTGQNMSSEYVVEADSMVTLPFLGSVKLAGMNINDAENYLNQSYAKTLLKDPIIKIFINNLKVTLLGEFNKQGNIPLKKDYIHLTEILGDAGGFTVKANTSRVKIIRGDLKAPEVIQVNLKNIKSLGDPKLYLRNNDILYVDAKPSARFLDELNSARTLISIAVSLISVYLITDRIR